MGYHIFAVRERKSWHRGESPYTWTEGQRGVGCPLVYKLFKGDFVGRWRKWLVWVWQE